MFAIIKPTFLSLPMFPGTFETEFLGNMTTASHVEAFAVVPVMWGLLQS